MAKPAFESFLVALEVLATVFAKLRQQRLPVPVIVGGAAVEHYTTGNYLTGDFDLVTPYDRELRVQLLSEGFRDEDRPGRLRRGFYHPQLCFGVEVVGSRLFDGHTSRTTAVPDEQNPELVFATVEDVIADRMGQFNSTRSGDQRMLEQAIMLFALARALDRDYLDRRIRQEAPDYDLNFLEARANDAPPSQHAR